MQKLLVNTKAGLYCPQGDFYIDPSRVVERAVITHAHSDHARKGHKYYLSSNKGSSLLKSRLGDSINLETLEYGNTICINGVTLSLHPAGHILGSSQVRIEYQGYVAVVSGDYKIEKDLTCDEFEVVKCHTFVTESTFALPVFRWCSQSDLFTDINRWWNENKEEGSVSVIFGYSLGKAQRILSGLDPETGPIAVLDTIKDINKCYIEKGIKLPSVYDVRDQAFRNSRGKMIVAPPNYIGSNWLKRFGSISCAFASGWMQLRKSGMARGITKGFALSDHADWTDINKIVDATGAEEIWISHGYKETLARWLQEKGKRTFIISERQIKETDEPEGPEIQRLSEEGIDEEVC